MKTYTLTISPEYVSKWGTWEAIRELLQNAFDQRDWDSTCAVTFLHNPVSNSVIIETTTGRLSPRSLLLGNSSKATDKTLRGQFGEGYKLALLVLVRSFHPVKIFNGPEIWVPKLEFDADFSCDVLKIDVMPIGGASQGVRIEIGNIDSEEWAAISRNVNPNQTRDTILEQPEESGRVYVGGLYVTTMGSLKMGYAFAPGSLTLDRDRGMVDNFDVSLATSRLWTHKQGSDPDAVYEMIQSNAADTKYCEHHACASSPVTKIAYETFVSRNGDSVPVSTQAEVQKAQNAGIKWTLVPEPLRNLIRKIKKFVIPSSKSPSDRLREFLDAHQYLLTDDMKAELADIAEKFDGVSNSDLPAPPTERSSYVLQATTSISDDEMPF